MAFLGKMIRSLRAGDKKLAIHDEAFAGTRDLDVSSDAFQDGAAMPPEHAGAHGDFPPLRWSGAPDNTASFAVIVEDIDAPTPAPLVHAVAYGISGATASLEAGALPRTLSHQRPPAAIRMGHGFAGASYAPPTPIPGHGPHHYVFQVFALDTAPAFDHSPKKSEMVDAMRNHVTACGAVIGTYEAAG